MVVVATVVVVVVLVVVGAVVVVTVVVVGAVVVVSGAAVVTGATVSGGAVVSVAVVCVTGAAVVSVGESSEVHPAAITATTKRAIGALGRRILVNSSIPRTYRIQARPYMGNGHRAARTSIPWRPVDCEPRLMMLAAQLAQSSLLSTDVDAAGPQPADLCCQHANLTFELVFPVDQLLAITKPLFAPQGHQWIVGAETKGGRTDVWRIPCPRQTTAC